MALLPLALAWPLAASAQTPSGPEHQFEAQAQRVAEGPVLDGRLDDGVWQDVPALRGFVEREPSEGVPAADDTELRFVYTDYALYIGARMYGDPKSIRADVTRRDVEGDAEQLAISLDTFFDKRTAYTFVVTAAGGRIDYLHPEDFENRRDYSFDPVWEAEVAMDGQGWTAEMRIPFTQLRFHGVQEQVWGLNAKRVRPALQEESLWQLVGRDETGWASRMGLLTGLAGIRPARRVELTPYIASAATVVSGVDTANPFDSRANLGARVGGDLKIGLGPSLTLDATLNPDFGQVDADPAEVNLSAFETFYDERRPFFTEGSRLFDLGNVFYSRRIGAPPQWSPDADYVDRVDNTTILGAAKVTGRLPSGLSVGVLGALTDRETVRTFDTSSGRFNRVAVEPLTAFSAARVEQQYGSNNSTVGAIFTGVRRDFDGSADLTERLPREAVAGGIDGRLRWRGGEYDLNWRVIGTHVAGSAGAITRQQRLSRRYFQRPDADYVSVDSTQTALNGYMLGLGHSRAGADHWIWNVDLWAESPGFEPNDLGRLGVSDGVGGYGNIQYRENTPGSFYRRYSLGLEAVQEWNYGWAHTTNYYGMFNWLVLPNFWETGLSFFYNPPAQSPSLTRGGPLMTDPGYLGTEIDLESPAGQRFRWILEAGGGNVPGGGKNRRIQTTVEYRPTARFSLEVTPEWSRRVNTQQYVTTWDDGPAATFGSRYVFARIEQSEISARIRANYAINPDLTVEGYMEPFVSSGEYGGFAQLRAASTNDLLTYGNEGTEIVENGAGDYTVRDGAFAYQLEDPSYNVRSFRSNLVLRWEWRRGSTLYLVWQQNRAGDGPLRERAGPDDLLGTLGSPGDNYFAVKATYWVPW